LPWKPPNHCPSGWQRAKRVRTDGIDRAYGSQAWRKLAAAVIVRDRGICHICGKPGADTAHHLVEKRRGGTDAPANLRAVHRGCHNRVHGGRGFFHKQEPCLRPAWGFAYPWPK
jgi:5-methylcytosine-specific restriction endonuclease McrA